MSRGNSFANGPTPYRWASGYQAPPPVSCYTLTEGHDYR
jgi:hypothetical protein